MIGAARLGSSSRDGRRIAPAIPVAIGIAWALCILAEATGKAKLLHHDSLLENGPPLWLAVGLFLVSWQVMIAAMMLPSSLPMIRLFGVTSRSQPRPRAVMGAFLGGYAVVWTAFGFVAFFGDLGLHRFVDRTPWLAAHEWVIAGGTLVLAGAFQFSSLKEKCLTECRHPGAFLMQHYRRGVGEAFRIGRKHGVFCLGCCWALMMLMFAAGVANLAWMAVLAGLMVYEKVGTRGEEVTRVAGFALLALGGMVLLGSGSLPGVLGG
jgi:predicted metal-binding membrane protein